MKQTAHAVAILQVVIIMSLRAPPPQFPPPGLIYGIVGGGPYGPPSDPRRRVLPPMGKVRASSPKAPVPWRFPATTRPSPWWQKPAAADTFSALPNSRYACLALPRTAISNPIRIAPGCRLRVIVGFRARHHRTLILWGFRFAREPFSVQSRTQSQGNEYWH